MDTKISTCMRPLAACIVGVSLAAGLLSASAVAADDGRDRHHREVIKPYHTDHWVLDQRYRHNHYYPALGYTVTVLPPGYMALSFGNRRFFFQGGVWFQAAGPRYVVVRPPLGVVVPVLPSGFTTVLIAGTPYYYANDVYYASAPGGYAVVVPPAGADLSEAPALPQAAPMPAPSPASAPQASPGMWYYCESAKTYYPYVAECKEAWRPVPATPLQPPR